MENIRLKNFGSRIEMEFTDGNKGTAYLCIADIAHLLLTERQEKEIASELIKRYDSYTALKEENEYLKKQLNGLQNFVSSLPERDSV